MAPVVGTPAREDLAQDDIPVDDGAVIRVPRLYSRKSWRHEYSPPSTWAHASHADDHPAPSFGGREYHARCPIRRPAPCSVELKRPAVVGHYVVDVDVVVRAGGLAVSSLEVTHDDTVKLRVRMRSQSPSGRLLPRIRREAVNGVEPGWGVLLSARRRRWGSRFRIDGRRRLVVAAADQRCRKRTACDKQCESPSHSVNLADANRPPHPFRDRQSVSRLAQQRRRRWRRHPQAASVFRCRHHLRLAASEWACRYRRPPAV